MKQDSIQSKDLNINPIIYQILNEAYQEFKEVHGTKHSQHIKQLIENITDKVRMNRDTYYMAPIAIANAQQGISYSTTKNISAILKHEMWHVYNSTNMGNPLQTISENYKKQLIQNGYLKLEYEHAMQKYREDFKDEPERLKVLLCSYEDYSNNWVNFSDDLIEMWTEWFNTITHEKDMKPNFIDWENGFYTQTNSSGSYYDYFLNIATMISCIIPKDKLLDMYLDHEEYKTGYSHLQMTEDFDKEYIDALNPTELEYYKYPYLKLNVDIKNISENAKKNPQFALKSLQSAIKTCFNAYFIKLDNTKNFDSNKAKEIYSQIKLMQKNMLWNIDISKMKDLDYVQVMQKIQDKFKNMVQELDLTNPEIQQMLNTINYDVDNPYKLIKDGNDIATIMLQTETEEKNNYTNISTYEASVGNMGIKGNLYRSLFTTLGKEKLNLLFENFNPNNDQNNPLLAIHKQIENANTNDDVKNTYDAIYNLYLDGMEKRLNIDDNITGNFKKIAVEISKLQQNALFDKKNNSYMPKLEEILVQYKHKLQLYEQIIENSISKITQKYINEGRNPQRASESAKRLPMMCIHELEEHAEKIDSQRKEDLQISSKPKSTQSLGKETLEEQSDTNLKQEEQQLISNLEHQLKNSISFKDL